MPLTLKAFLSHRYKSPAVNNYFHRVFSEVAELQFDVDAARGATNVTRLERMIRDADAFVGIYPYDGDDTARPTRAQLLEASTYFRLELELATRARIPAAVFVDGRYGPVIAPPPSMFVQPFDHYEVTGTGGSPNRDSFRRTFSSFCENVGASMLYERTRQRPLERAVGILLPPDAYSAEIVEGLESRLTTENVDVQRIPWPVVFNVRTLGMLQSFDWVVADVGTTTIQTGLAAYLHGQFIPTLRLSKYDKPATDGAPATGDMPLDLTLYGGIEVGYRKDIVRWSTADELFPAFEKRLARLLQEGRRIGSTSEAENYFREAALRKEPVFVSYSGRDEAVVAPITEALRRRFQSVFDYRDGGESIEPGRPWLDEIFRKLDQSAVAMPILSATYLESGNCLHEARSIIAARDAGKLTVLPVKLTRDDLTLPAFLTDVQYLRSWEYESPDTLAERVVKALG